MDPRDDDPAPPGAGPESPEREDSLLGQALGRAIKVIRTGLDIGRPELAERAGLSYSYLAEIENGKKQASSAALQAIANGLGIAVSELMAAAEEWQARMLEAQALREEQAEERFLREPLEEREDRVAKQQFDADRGISQLREQIRTLMSSVGRAGEGAPAPPRSSASGARARQLRWFREGAAARVWDEADTESRRSSRPRRRRLDATQAKRPLEADARERMLRRLVAALERLSPADIERVVDLAKRLGKK